MRPIRAYVIGIVCIFLGSCGYSKEIPDAKILPSSVSTVQRTKVEVDDINKRYSTNASTCSGLVAKPGSDLERTESRIRTDLKSIGKSDGQIETYLERWRCENSYLFK